MVDISYIISGLFTGVILVALVTALARARQWRTAPPRLDGAANKRGDGDVAAMVTEIARTPLAWTVGFLVLVFAVGAATFAFVSGAVSTAVAQVAGIGVAVLFVSILGAYLFWGVYHSARSRGLPDAQATLAGLWVFGSLLIITVILNLIISE